MNCPNCRHENSSTAKFCEECGHQLKGICPSCQHQNKPTAKFCIECGKGLQPEARERPSYKTETSAITTSKPSAERRQLTVLFCDLVGSTALSAKLDAEEYRQVILDYQQVAEKAIQRYGGHIAQYLGDGLLVYFGYPKGLEDAPRAAVRAGLGIREAVAHANQSWAAAGKTTIAIRIGIHTGLVVVDDRLAMGDTTNIAARLEGLAPENGLVISPKTMKLVQGWFEVQSLGEHQLKGIVQPVEVLQVLHESGARTRLEAVRGRGLSPLVGREEELNLLKHAWKESKQGQGQIVLLHGEAGIGKSRLVESLKNHIAAEPQAWLTELRCSAHQSNAAFYPLLDLLEHSVLQWEKGDSPAIKMAKLEGFVLQAGLDRDQSLPLLAELLSIPFDGQYAPSTLNPAAKKQKMMEALIQGLLNRAAEQPVLLVVEDLHWADPSTLEWLDLLLERLPAHPIFALGTTRPGFQSSWVGNANFSQLNLHRLSVDRIEAICNHQTGGKSLPTEVLDQIKVKTDGIPLYVEELTRMIVESGLLRERENAYELKGPLPPLAIPATLQDSLIARLDKLGSGKEIAQIGSVLGREFSIELLQAISPRNESSLKKDLAQLMEAGLLFQKGSPPRIDYIFKHALIQDTAYGSLLKSKRRELHQQVVEVMEENFSEIIQQQPALLAHHQTQAGLSGPAVFSWIKAAQLARKQYANKEAIANLQKGLSLTSLLIEKDKALDCEYTIFYLLSNYIFTEFGFNHPELKNVNEQLILRAQKLGRFNEIVMNQIALIIGEMGGGNIYIKGKLEALLSLATTDGDDFSKGAIQCFMGVVSLITGEYRASKIHCETALQLYQPAEHEHLKLFNGSNLRVEIMAHYLLVLQLLGYPDQAKEGLTLLQKWAEEHRNLHDLFLIYIFLPYLHLILKDNPPIIPITEKGLASLEGSEDTWVYGNINMQRNNALARMGDEEAAFKAHELTSINRQRLKFFNGMWYSNLGETFLSLDLPEKGLEVVEDGLAGLEATGERFCLPNLCRLKGDFLLMLKKSEVEAEQFFLKAIEISQEQSSKWHELLAAKSLARLWQSQGKTQEAYDLLNGVYSWFTEGFDTVDMREAKELLEELSEGMNA